MAQPSLLRHSSACMERTQRSALPLGSPALPQRSSARQLHSQQAVHAQKLHEQVSSAVQQALSSMPAVARSAQAVQGVAAAAVLSAVLLTAGPSLASDARKVGTCLLGNCQLQLARCLGDGQCLEDLVCLNLCNNRKDEQACQIKCGDKYSDKAINTFNECAVSDKKCVPQRVETDFQEPTKDQLAHNFELDKFQGRWYITAGLNPLFDTFDCQEHYFGVPEQGQLLGKINWRIPKGKKDFIERSTVQKFKQQEEPALLLNRGNDYLHYEDDWFIVGSKPDVYQFIVYRGNNDAWKGYFGATVYTREASLPQELIPELQREAQSVGLKWEDFKITDNSCPPHPPKRGLSRAEQLAEDELKAAEQTLFADLTSFGKGFTVVERGLLAELQKDERNVEGVITADLRKAESFLENIEAQYKLPKWMPFRDFVFRFPWDKVEPQEPQIPSRLQNVIPNAGVAAQIPLPGARE